MLDWYLSSFRTTQSLKPGFKAADVLHGNKPFSNYYRHEIEFNDFAVDFTQEAISFAIHFTEYLLFGQFPPLRQANGKIRDRSNMNGICNIKSEEVM